MPCFPTLQLLLALLDVVESGKEADSLPGAVFPDILSALQWRGLGSGDAIWQECLQGLALVLLSSVSA